MSTYNHLFLSPNTQYLIRHFTRIECEYDQYDLHVHVRQCFVQHNFDIDINKMMCCSIQSCEIKAIVAHSVMAFYLCCIWYTY